MRFSKFTRKMAAAYLFHLCQNHAFIDGNKRVGANAARTFLLMNDWEPTFNETEFVDIAVSCRQTSKRVQMWGAKVSHGCPI